MHMKTVKTSKHNKFAEENEFYSYVMSAKTGDNVAATFTRVAADLAGVVLTKAELDVQVKVLCYTRGSATPSSRHPLVSAPSDKQQQTPHPLPAGDCGAHQPRQRRPTSGRAAKSKRRCQGPQKVWQGMFHHVATDTQRKNDETRPVVITPPTVCHSQLGHYYRLLRTRLLRRAAVVVCVCQSTTPTTAQSLRACHNH